MRDHDDGIDIDFLEACQRGDVNAFSELYERHAPAIMRFAWSRLGDRSKAEDVLQETFVTAWDKRRKSTIVDLSLLPWLLAICRNHIMNQQRKTVRDRERTVELTEFEERPRPVEDLSWIADEMSKLSELDRRICQLCLIEGKTYKQAASEVERSPAVVGKRLQRARARLQEASHESQS